MKKIKLAKRYSKFSEYLYESCYKDDERHCSNEPKENIIRDYACKYQIHLDGFFNSTIANKIADRYLHNKLK